MKKIIVFISFTLLKVNYSIAQFTLSGIVANRYGETTNFPAPQNTRSIGIGNFSSGGSVPLSALHINANYLSVSPAFAQGEVFRTDCPSGLATYWRMHRGGIQYGLFFNNNDSHLGIEATQGDLYFNTGGANQRVRILGTNGYVGIGDAFSVPSFRVHVFGNSSNNNDAGILSSNNFFGSGSVLPAGLNNSLMIWYPKKAAFRAGYDSGGFWDDTNTGEYSVAFGQNNYSRNKYTFAFGLNNDVSGERSFTGGQNNVTAGISDVVYGDANTVNANGSTCVGSSNTIDGTAVCFGSLNDVDPGASGYIFGASNVVTGTGAFAFAGPHNIAANSSFVYGENNTNTNLASFSVIFGQGNQNNAANSFILGLNSFTDGSRSYSFGENVKTSSTATNSYVFGTGYTLGSPLLNSIDHSFMVGFNSTVSTFTVVAPVTAGVGATGRIGIANSAPGNTMEITSNTANPSGLRFTNLTSTSATVPNPGTGVLTVDANGDVIYTNGSSGITSANNGLTIAPTSTNVQWGQVNSGTSSLSGGELLHDTEIPLNNYTVYFRDPTPSSVAGQNRVQVGDFTGGFPYVGFSKFSSICGENNTSLFRVGSYSSTTSNFSISSVPIQFLPNYFGSISAGYKIGNISIASTNDATGFRFIGSSSLATDLSSLLNVGSSGKAYGSAISNIGLYGIAGSTGCNSNNYGVFGFVNTSGVNYGVYGVASLGTDNYSIYGESPTPSVGPCGPGVYYAGYFNGDIVVNGSILPSDANLKENINPISNANSILKQLKPKTFNFKTSSFPSMSLPSGLQYGLVAQDVETVLSNVVSVNTHPAKFDSTGTVLIPSVSYKGIKYDQFIPILIQASNEHQENIDSLKAVIKTQDSLLNVQEGRLNTIENCLNNLGICEESRSLQPTNEIIINQTNVELTNAKNIVLNQNVPNPFAEQTIITYTLLEGTKKAEMHFYNSEGKRINSVELSTAAGKGQLNVFANDLTNGIYTYTLVVDGKIIDTKRMIRDK